MSWQCAKCDTADRRCHKAGRCMAGHLGPVEPVPELTEEDLAQLDPFLRALLEESFRDRTAT